jgi:23S rRNA-/tRNA-specific pseudouridylate synthase
LLDLVPVTGRTNQLRIHCAHVGHPLVGDRLYGDPDADAAVGASGRLCLHACALAFNHPVTGKPLTFELPLPLEFTQLLGED